MNNKYTYLITILCTGLMLPAFGFGCPLLKSLEQHLKEAIQRRDLRSIDYYISVAAEVNYAEGRSQPSMGKTLLSYAINSDSVDVVKILLKAGATVEDQSDLPGDIGIKLGARYLPHLSYAIAVNASLEIINALIEYSKELNICDFYNGRTPYEIAQHYDRGDVMIALEKAGAKTYDIVRPYYLNQKNI